MPAAFWMPAHQMVNCSEWTLINRRWRSLTSASNIIVGDIHSFRLLTPTCWMPCKTSDGKRSTGSSLTWVFRPCSWTPLNAASPSGWKARWTCVLIPSAASPPPTWSTNPAIKTPPPPPPPPGRYHLALRRRKAIPPYCPCHHRCPTCVYHQSPGRDHRRCNQRSTRQDPSCHAYLPGAAHRRQPGTAIGRNLSTAGSRSPGPGRQAGCDFLPFAGRPYCQAIFCPGKQRLYMPT